MRLIHRVHCCRPHTKYGEGSVFHSVHKIWRGGLPLPSMHHWSHDQGLCTEWQTPLPPNKGKALFRPPPNPPGKDTTGYGQQAGGTHPTGMHSCICDCGLNRELVVLPVGWWNKCICLNNRSTKNYPAILKHLLTKIEQNASCRYRFPKISFFWFRIGLMNLIWCI